MTSFWGNKRVVVTGGAGFLGRHVVSALLQRGVDRDRIMVPRSAMCDLRQGDNCLRATYDQDIVIHLAGKVGSIGYNHDNLGT